ncbi:MAG: hypothetical protein E7Z84_00395 [Methanosphaera stadtmanae]|nr:hypothetical protein [Methanosphaera stadtmanae]
MLSDVETMKFSNINNMDSKFFNPIKYLLTSSIRLEIMLTLNESKKNFKEIKKIVNKQDTNILRALKELENEDWIINHQKIYSLTSIGFLTIQNTINVINTWYAVNTMDNYWDNHNLNGIPLNILRYVDVWRHAKLISSTIIEYNKAVNCYLNNISKSKEIKVILPIFSKFYIEGILDSIQKNNGKLELITSNEILNAIKESDLKEQFTQLKDQKKLRIWIGESETHKLFLTFTDKFSSIQLFYFDQTFDDSNILITKDIDKNRFNEIFNEYKNEYKEI